MESEIIEKYGDRLRIRVCGMCWSGDRLLVANHHLVKGANFWAPVGGGLEYGETVLQALAREFKEEANIIIRSGKFQFGCEFISHPLHAIELFFEVDHESGEVTTGKDPESSQKNQILQDVRYLDFNDLIAIRPNERHGIFRYVETAEQMKKLSGFYTI